MTAEIKPIETMVSGYRMRSRLEARWSCFLNAQGIPYEYEREGYDLGPLGWYLPDFWLPHVRMFAEVKPGPFTPEELAKCEAMAAKFPVLLLEGLPDFREYDAIVSQGQFRGFVETLTVKYTISRARTKEPWRFWTDNECETPEDYDVFFPGYSESVNVSRAARFEHGEGVEIRHRHTLNSEEMAMWAIRDVRRLAITPAKEPPPRKAKTRSRRRG